jgi:hypothetical protein
VCPVNSLAMYETQQRTLHQTKLYTYNLDRYNECKNSIMMTEGTLILQKSNHMFHNNHPVVLDTDLYYCSYRLPNLEKEVMAGVIDRQGMLTPPWHLIPRLIYSEVCVRPFSNLYFLLDLWDWILFVIFIMPCRRVVI